MGTSVVDFGAHGFWLNDGHFELLLHLLANEVDREPHPEEWLLALRDDWRQESTSGAIGCHNAHLDDLESSGDPMIVAGLAERAYSRVAARSQSLSAEKGVRTDSGAAVAFVGDIPKEWFLQGLEALIRLLKGELQVTPESFPVLPITPGFHLWKPSDPELLRINNLWIALQEAHFDVSPGQSILDRVLTKIWESPDPRTRTAWDAIVRPENLKALGRWKAESPFGFSIPTRKDPMQGLAGRDACEEALRQSKANQP
jgi:hypothetical protein